MQPRLIVSASRPRINVEKTLVNLEKVLGDYGKPQPSFKWEAPAKPMGTAKPAEPVELVTPVESLAAPIVPLRVFELVSIRSAMPGFVGIVGREAIQDVTVKQQLHEPMAWLSACAIIALVAFGSLFTLDERLKEDGDFAKDVEYFNGRNALLGLLYILFIN